MAPETIFIQLSPLSPLKGDFMLLIYPFVTCVDPYPHHEAAEYGSNLERDPQHFMFICFLIHHSTNLSSYPLILLSCVGGHQEDQSFRASDLLPEDPQARGNQRRNNNNDNSTP